MKLLSIFQTVKLILNAYLLNILKTIDIFKNENYQNEVV